MINSSKTKIFGLIGDPIDKSLSPIIHNAVFKEIGWNAIYLKIPTKKEDLAETISTAKKNKYSGLSVTQPLKEDVISYLDEIDPTAEKIGAVNTLSFRDGKIYGTNTDSIGALQAIEEVIHVKNKDVVILGAGGAVRAVAYILCEQKANVTILNRSAERAKTLAEHFKCKWGLLEDIPNHYDILINGTPHPMPINKEQIQKNAVVMDLKNQVMLCELLQCAKNQGCIIVPGYHMFLYQAIQQYKVWNDGTLNLDQVAISLKNQVLKVYQ